MLVHRKTKPVLDRVRGSGVRVGFGVEGIPNLSGTLAGEPLQRGFGQESQKTRTRSNFLAGH